MVSNMFEKFLEFDELSPDGTFTVSSRDDIDMLALREYCLKNRIGYGDLSDINIMEFKIGISNKHVPSRSQAGIAYSSINQ